MSPDNNNNIRDEILNLIGQSSSTKTISAEMKDQMRTLLTSYYNNNKNVCDDDDDDDDMNNDVLFQIGKTVYGIDVIDDDDACSKKDKKVKTAAAVVAVEEEEATKKNKEVCVVNFDVMKQFMKDVFLSYGVTPDRAEVCSEVLIEADRRGIDSHGLGRLKPIYCDRMDNGILFPERPITVLKETDTTALVDGNLGLGLYIGPYCMQMAIDKAKKHGVGFVAVGNSTHYGIAGYYATMASNAGCIGLTGTNARPSIAPTFGVEPMLGTNPLCFGIPSNDDFPFVLDCATSINQRGKIEKYARDGVDTPKGAVIDEHGIERTDTEGILRDMVLGKCALCPVGGAGDATAGYKGYGWATVVELMSIAFQSGPFGEDVCGIDRKTGKPCPMPLGHFFLAIDIEPLCSLDTFKANTGQLLRALRASKKAPTGPGRIWTAGEPEWDARCARNSQGGMPVPTPLQKNMIALRESRPGLKEKYTKFPFE